MNLSTLISLNIGWAAKFKILLDSDIEGKKQKERYMKDFSLPASQFVLHSDDRPEIEDMFEKAELSALYKFAFDEDVEKLNKKQFLQLMSVLSVKKESDKEKISPLVGKETKDRCRKLLHALKE